MTRVNVKNIKDAKVMFFGELAEKTIPYLEYILQYMYPLGIVLERDFAIGSIKGEPGKSLKVSLSSGVWADFGTGETGRDIINLYAEMKGIELQDAAIAIVSIMVKIPHTSRSLVNSLTYETKTKIEAMRVVPANAPAPNFNYSKGDPSAIYYYHDSYGNILGFVVRFDGRNGKDFRPLTWCQNEEGEQFWSWKGFPKPYPIYGLYELGQDEEKPVLIVEGEKCAAAGREILKDFVVVSWLGGSGAVDHVDWKPLFGRKVYLWPDNDKQGRKAMNVISGILAVESDKIRCLDFLIEKDDGWDIADAISQGWKEKRIVNYIKHKTFI